MSAKCQKRTLKTGKNVIQGPNLEFSAALLGAINARHPLEGNLIEPVVDNVDDCPRGRAQQIKVATSLHPLSSRRRVVRKASAIHWLDRDIDATRENFADGVLLCNSGR